MIALNEIKNELARPVWNKAQVARETGIPYDSLLRVLRIDNPSYLIVKRLSDYLESNALMNQRNIAEQRLNDPKYAAAAAEIIGAIDARANK